MRNFKASTITFILLLLVVFVIGCLIPLRPAYSTMEKRDLSKFPIPTVASVWNGSFFSDMTSWYADTFPLRESMIGLNSKMDTLYGFKSEAIFGESVKEAEEIPDAEEIEVAPTLDLDEVEEFTEGTGTIGDEPEYIGSVYVAGGRAFEMFYFAKENADAYASMLNTVVSMLPDNVKVYDILLPNSMGIYLDEDTQRSIKSSNQKEAIDYSYARMDNRISKMHIYDRLRSHNDEYLYFRTDHHWTARGAYYAYEAFCEEKGIKPAPIDSFEMRRFDGFLGSFYASTGQSPILYDNMDYVEAFVPKSTNSEILTQRDGNPLDWNIIHDVNSYPENQKYSCFIGGDYPLITIKNPNLSDGSSVLVIKESYGNAFVPFLVDHYENVYVIDYRYYKDNITNFITQNGIGDVIFVNGLTAATEKRSKEILSLFVK